MSYRARDIDLVLSHQFSLTLTTFASLGFLPRILATVITLTLVDVTQLIYDTQY